MKHLCEAVAKRTTGKYDSIEFPKRRDIGDITRFLKSNGFVEVENYISIRGDLVRGLKGNERYYTTGKLYDGEMYVRFWTSRYDKYTMEFYISDSAMYTKFFDDPMDLATTYKDYDKFKTTVIELIKK